MVAEKFGEVGQYQELVKGVWYLFRGVIWIFLLGSVNERIKLFNVIENLCTFWLWRLRIVQRICEYGGVNFYVKIFNSL